MADLEKIVESLGYAHKNGVYHGDIHLGNIMVEENDIKIIDFGTSIFVSNQNSKHKREIRLLINLVREMFPEFDLFGLEKAKKLNAGFVNSIYYNEQKVAKS